MLRSKSWKTKRELPAKYSSPAYSDIFGLISYKATQGNFHVNPGFIAGYVHEIFICFPPVINFIKYLSVSCLNSKYPTCNLFLHSPTTIYYIALMFYFIIIKLANIKLITYTHNSHFSLINFKKRSNTD